MSILNPSQSSLSNHREWVRPQQPSIGSGLSPRRFDDWNRTSRERYGQWAIMFVAALGLAVSGYLAWVSLTSSKLAGCGAGDVFDCGHVMSTKWSALFGVPVSVPALFVYSAILTSIAVTWNARSSKVRDTARLVLVLAALTAALSAVWFISLQLFVVDHLCVYCLAAHACSLVIAGLLLWTQSVTSWQLLRTSSIALVAVGILATLQILSPAPKTYEIQTFETPTSISMDQSSGELFQYPVTDADVFEAPVVETPVFEAPVFEAPVFEAPASKTSESRINQHENDLSKNLEAPHVAPVHSRASAKATLSSNLAVLTASLFSPNLNLVTVGMVVPRQENQDQDLDQQKRTDDQQPAQRRLVGLNGGKVQLNVAHWPICGKQTAKTIGIEMFDYTCPHCRHTHHALKSARQQSNHEFAVLSLAVPMNTQCNPAVKSTNAQHATACELAKLSVAVWRLDPTKYDEYHDWLFTGEQAPSVASAKSKAESMVGAEPLQKEFETGVPQQYIAKQCQLYQSVGEGVIPKIYIGNSVITGQIQSADTLLQMINQR